MSPHTQRDATQLAREFSPGGIRDLVDTKLVAGEQLPAQRNVIGRVIQSPDHEAVKHTGKNLRTSRPTGLCRTSQLGAMVLAISVTLGVSGCGTVATIFGGPADATTTSHIAAQITTALKQQGAPGSISRLTARHVGSGPGGIEVKFTYSETVNGRPASVPVVLDNLTFDDHGEAHEGYPSLESSVRDAIVQANPFTSYPGYTTLRDQNTANVRKALAADRVGRMTIAVRVRDSASDLVIDQSWFDHTAAANLKSDNQEAKAFFGYYDIPPQEALAHLTLGIDFEDDSVAIQDANSENNAGNCAPLRSLLDQDWSQIKMLLAAPDTHALPDLSYQAKLQTTAIPSVPGPESSYSAQSASFRFVDGHPDPRDAFDGAAVPCGLGSTLPNAPASQPSTTTH